MVGCLGLIASDPVMLPQRSVWPELQAAVPELTMVQPRGVPRLVFVSESFLHKDYATSWPRQQIRFPCLRGTRVPMASGLKS